LFRSAGAFKRPLKSDRFSIAFAQKWLYSRYLRGLDDGGSQAVNETIPRGYTMRRMTVVSTKGGVGKTTVAANLGGLFADLDYRVLLVDADVQPTLSSYYAIRSQATGGLFQLLVSGVTENVISSTIISNLDLIVSNDPTGQLPNLLLHAPDGRTRLRHLLDQIDTPYDVVILDTQGSLGVLQDAAVLASDLLISPLPPEMLSAREFSRGTLDMLERLRPMSQLGLPVPPLVAVLNRIDRTRNALQIAAALRDELFTASKDRIRLLETVIPNLVAYREAACLGVPVHRHESTRPVGRTAPAARETMLALAHELLPDRAADVSRLSSETLA